MRSIKWTTALAALAIVLALAVSYSPAVAAPTPQASQQAQAEAESWTGKVEQMEVQGMKTYVLVVGGQKIPLEPQTKAAAFAGKTVKVTGKMEGGKVVISSIEEA